METPQLKIMRRQESISKLFRQLFDLNTQLESWSERNTQFKSEISDAIIAIEKLMESILQDEN